VTATKEEKNQGEKGVQLEEEKEKESLEEVTEQADNGDLPMVKRALIGF